MVMQDVNHQLFTESVLDEILLSMRTEDKQRAREILQEMDLLSFEDCHPMGLSGGQKQRVAVASAIASGPVSYTHLDVYKRQLTRSGLSLNIPEMTGRNLFTPFRKRRLLNRVPIYRKSAGVWLLLKREPENWKN